MTMSPMTALVMGSVDRAKAGAASGVLSMTRMIGGAFGVASLTAIFDHISSRPASRPGHSPHDVFIYALSSTLLISSVIALLGAVIAAIFVRSHHAEPTAVPTPRPRPRRPCASRPWPKSPATESPDHCNDKQVPVHIRHGVLCCTPLTSPNGG